MSSKVVEADAGIHSLAIAVAVSAVSFIDRRRWAADEIRFNSP